MSTQPPAPLPPSSLVKEHLERGREYESWILGWILGDLSAATSVKVNRPEFPILSVPGECLGTYGGHYRADGLLENGILLEVKSVRSMLGRPERLKYEACLARYTGLGLCA